MTSVLSHLPRLSGNNILVAVVAVTLSCLLLSCSGSKKTISNSPSSTTTKKNPNTNQGQRATGKVDTIRWTEIDRTKEYEKTIEDLDLDKRDSYKVSLLYPFAIDSNKDTDANVASSNLGRMTQFYAGTQMALAKLQDENITLEVTVLDAESGTFDSKLRQCRNADVIIGPKERGQLATTAQYGKNNQIPVISPWLSSTKVAKDNPFYIQLKPSLKNHMTKIVKDVKINFKDDQVFLLGRKTKKDRGMMNYIQKVADAYTKGSDKKPFKEYYLEEDSLLVGETAYDSIFYTDKKTVFILPNWSFVDDEKFVYNAVRKMSGEKGLNDVVLYGMPILLESDRVKFEHYNNLNMRICRTSYLDRESVAVKEFRQEYYDKYKGFPSEEAFEGFDMMMFVGRSLNNYGKKFQYFLDTYEASLYQTEYEVLKVFNKNSGDSFDDIQYFQNNHLYILEFKDNHFIAN